MPGDYLCNDWDEAILHKGRYTTVTTTANKDGAVDLYTEDAWGMVTTCVPLTLEQLERLVVWARAMKEVFG